MKTTTTLLDEVVRDLVGNIVSGRLRRDFLQSFAGIAEGSA
jgi:hypothetical protein